MTVDDALSHPTWNMGRKITTDSATLMNKGFEIIEAAHLFGFGTDMIDVVVHRESIVHSMVAYKDGAVIAQLGLPSMKTCIAYSLFCPAHIDGVTPLPDLAKIGALSFFSPDEDTFGAMRIARHAFNEGGTLPAILNYANDTAVGLFLDKKIKFTDITALVGETVHNFERTHNKLNYPAKFPGTEDILSAGDEAKEYVLSLVGE